MALCPSALRSIVVPHIEVIAMTVVMFSRFNAANPQQTLFVG
jgi:hypothetical protein